MSLLTSFFGKRKQEEVVEAATVLDLVTYTAGLASNPDDIAIYLDKVREVTARLGSTPPNSKDEATLINVYFQLETYLTTKEPIRTFTKEGLRKRAAAPLIARLDQHETGTTASI